MGRAVRNRGGDDRFLAVGEKLPLSVDLAHDGRLDALCTERFKHAVRCGLGFHDEAQGRQRSDLAPTVPVMVIGRLGCYTREADPHLQS